MSVWEWFSFGLPSGQALFVVGCLDLMIAIARVFETYSIFFHEEPSRLRLTGFSHHLDYMEYFQLGLESLKITSAIALWIGGLLCGSKSVIRGWMYFTSVLELILQLVIWTVQYHILLTNSEAMPLVKLTYSGVIRILIRAYLITAAYTYFKSCNAATTTVDLSNRSAGGGDGNINTGGISRLAIAATAAAAVAGPSRSSTNLQEDIEFYPVGLGILQIAKFYYVDIKRLVILLLTVDLGWGLIRLLESELSQILFGQQIKSLPSSTKSTPIWTEERIVRLIRVLFDLLFLTNMRKDEPPFMGHSIIPKVIEILVSLGILIFIRIAEYGSFPSTSVFVIYYILYIFDIIFRICTFALCYKVYADFLCQRRRTDVANAKSRALNLLGK